MSERGQIILRAIYSAAFVLTFLIAAWSGVEWIHAQVELARLSTYGAGSSIGSRYYPTYYYGYGPTLSTSLSGSTYATSTPISSVASALSTLQGALDATALVSSGG